MVNRIFSVIGCLGTALVLGAVGVWSFLPAREFTKPTRPRNFTTRFGCFSNSKSH